MVQHNKPRWQSAAPHLFDWVDHTLRSVTSTPKPGSFDPDDANALKNCPVCGHVMREHTIVHGAHDTILNCPVPHPGAWDRDAFEPVNEFGMVIHRRQEQPDTE